MKSDFLIAITQLAAERKLPQEVVLTAIQNALASAYKKDALVNSNIAVRIMPNTGEVKVYKLMSVVDAVADPDKEITAEGAQLYKRGAKVGDTIEIESTPANAGRIAAQTAKQVVVQRLREAERDIVFEEFAAKEDAVVSCVVQRIEGRNVFVELGRAEALLPPTEQVPTEHYRAGQRMKVYIQEVSRNSKGPQVIVSRAHKNLLKRLFELEVPEITNGVVEIKSIAREPGFRSKVSVSARQEGVDAVGACVGLRGIRIQNIVNEMHGEKVDVVEWSKDPAIYIAKALSPAQVLHVIVNNNDMSSIVVVPDRQLSLAIGKEGQNARLAAKLTGWRIDIKSASQAEEEKIQKPAPPVPEAVVPAAEAPAPLRVQPAAQGPVPVEAPRPEPRKEPEPVGMSMAEALAKEETWKAPAAPSAPQVRFAEEILARSNVNAPKGKDKKAAGKVGRDGDDKTPKKGGTGKRLRYDIEEIDAEEPE